MDHIAEEYAEINDILNKSQENKNTDIAEQKLSDNIFFCSKFILLQLEAIKIDLILLMNYLEPINLENIKNKT